MVSVYHYKGSMQVMEAIIIIIKQTTTAEIYKPFPMCKALCSYLHHFTHEEATCDQDLRNLPKFQELGIKARTETKAV